MRRIDNRTLSVYLVTDRQTARGRALEEIVEEAVRGGVTIVQLREKNLETEEFVKLGKRFKSLLKPFNIPLIINDDVEVALACDADGVHIGQSDMSPVEARRILGPERIIGLSVENFDQVQQAQTFDIDYIAASPVYGTKTKKNTKTEFLPEGVRKMVRMSTHPVVGIGRMNEDTVRDVILAGAAGVAVVSAIIGAGDPRKAAQRISESVEAARMEMELETGKHLRWSKIAELSVKDILWKIKREPFCQEMKSGKLKYHRFNSFMVQNEWLFRQYVRLMRYLEIRTESDGNTYSIIRHFQEETASDTTAMHSFYLGETPEVNDGSGSSDSREIIGYLNTKVRQSPIHTAMAAMMTLPYLLSALGHYFVTHSNNESNRYITWMNLYGSQEFTYDFERFSDVVDSLAGNVSTHQKVQMLSAFRHCANLILSLWKSQI